MFFISSDGGLLSLSAKDSDKSSLFEELKNFTDVLTIVKRDYVQEVDDKKLIEGAIRGMLAALDPHSSYLDPDFYNDLQVQTHGEFGGLGIEISYKDGALTVVAPMEDSPAAKAGVRAGDILIKINGEFTKNLTLMEAIKKLRGPRGAPVTISVQRKGSPKLIDIEVVRDVIRVRSVKSRYLGDGIGLVRIVQFIDRTSDDVRSALSKLKKLSPAGELKGVILDLRNNPGGLLNQAVQVADLFLREGVIVYTDGRLKSQNQKFFAKERGTEPDFPMVVIVNGGSASAAEIVAGALKDHGRALVLGTRTFGKGSVQTITPLDNKGALTLTTSLYYTKSGNSIQLAGVSPDVVYDQINSDKSDKEAANNLVENIAGVVQGEQENNQEKSSLKDQKEYLKILREEDLPNAIVNPTNGAKTGGEKNKSQEEVMVDPELLTLDIERDKVVDLVSKDRQLAKAFDLVKGIKLAMRE